ncbi:MAG: succinyl-diaminopimelate desuccinylase [Acidimicrobiales bacterium]
MTRSRLAERCLDLVSIPSVSGNEAEIAHYLEGVIRSSAPEGVQTVRVGDNVVVRRPRDGAPRLVIAGHIDTVPPDPTDTVGIEGGRLRGVGSTDMKGGVAVMSELACLPAVDVDLTFVFYVCEEVDLSRNGLRQVFAAVPSIAEADAAILMEPTQNFVEAGCQGTLRALVKLRGVRAHSARPWMGTNAIERLAPVLVALERFERREPVLGGVSFRESLSAIRVSGGIANNVVPDEVGIWLNYRFAPDLTVESGFERLAEALREGNAIDPEVGDTVELEDGSPAAWPGTESPLLQPLIAQVPGVRAKLGWTDVAFFGERGIPAVNYGPGDPSLAHSAGEWLDLDELLPAYEALASLVVLSQ